MSDRPLRMLLVSHRYPWPLTRGDTLTVYKMAEFFGARHRVDLLCHEPESEETGGVDGLVHEVIRAPFSRLSGAGRLATAALTGLPFQVAWCSSGALCRQARRLHAERDYDVVLSYYVRPAEAVRHLSGRAGRAPAKVVAMQLSLALQFARGAEHAPSPVHQLARRWEARRLARYESAMFRDFDRCLLISPRDRAHVEGAIDKKVYYNPHGVDVEKFAPRPEMAGREPGNRSIVFTGLMRFHPNVDAVCYFYREIFDLVRQRVPEATFTIVGKEPSPAVRALAEDPAVKVTGTVPDIAAYLANAAVAVDPLRIGAGLQNKVLEAMSMAVPMVVTSVANEGIGAIEGEHLFMRDDPQSFAEAVVQLLQDPGLRARMGDRSRQWICENWTWEVHFERLDAMLRQLVDSRGGSGASPASPGNESSEIASLPGKAAG